MNITITLKNYRCFPENDPAIITIENGFTALVGANNSGKSTILKFFWEFRGIFEELKQTSILAELLNGKRRSINFPQTVRDPEEIFHNQNNKDLTVEIDFTPIDSTKFPITKSVLSKLIIDLPRSQERVYSIQTFFEKTKIPYQGIAINIDDKNNLTVKLDNKYEIDFSPLIQIASCFGQFLYIPAYRNPINSGENLNYFDIPVGKSFIGQWREWQAGDSKAGNLAALSLTRMIKKIFGYETLDVRVSSNNETLIFNVNDQTYKLSELGSGIAQFFMVLAITAVKNPPFLLIDEPELNLHPSLQKDFVECLGSYVKSGIIYSTHSLGLALSQADRIYSLSKNLEGYSKLNKYEETPRLSEFLGELNYAGYKELGYEKVLLVEGPSDLKVIQHFLSFYGKQNEVVLVPLGGRSMLSEKHRDELEEVRRICPKVYALIDSEKFSMDSDPDLNHQKFKEMCENLSPPIKCHMLERRAIENYYTEEAVKVLGENEVPLDLYNEPPGRHWKYNGWRIAQKMKKSDIASTDLGKFLESL